MNPPSTTAMPLAVTIEAVTGSDPCVPRTAGHPRLRVLGRADPGRPLAREMIRDAYRQVYGADVEPTCPWLVALGQDPGDRCLAIAGLRPAVGASLFVEHYLNHPLESILACPRTAIVEVGNVAASPGASRSLIVAMTGFLHGARFRFAVFTLVPALVNAFRRLGLPLRILADARLDRLPEEARFGWGSYYTHEPRVCAGDVRLGYRLLDSVAAADPHLSRLWMQSRREGRAWHRRAPEQQT